MKPGDDSRVMRGGNRYGRPFEGLDTKRQLAVLMDMSGRQNITRERRISSEFAKKRFQMMTIALTLASALAASRAALTALRFVQTAHLLEFMREF